MKKLMTKLIKMIPAVMAICLLVGATAQAEEVKKLHIDNYAFMEESMKVYLNTDADTLLTADNVEIILGDRSCEVSELDAFADTDEGVSYLFLVDVSGSVTTQDIENSKEILLSVVNLMGANDNAAIMLIRNEAVCGEFLQNKEDLVAAVEEISRTSEDTNLYLGVREALEQLQENDACNQRRCLVILSDGRDDQNNGILFEDARDMVKSAGVPICTVSMPLHKPSTADVLEPDKVMQSFTDNAAGGISLKYADTEMSNEEIGKEISDFVHGGYVLEFVPTDVVPNGTSMDLYVNVDTDKEMISKAACTVPSHEVSAVVEAIKAKQAAEEVAKEEAVEEPTETEEVAEESGSIQWWMIALAITVLLAAGGCSAFFILRAKKESKNEQEQSGQSETSSNESDSTAVTGGDLNAIVSNMPITGSADENDDVSKTTGADSLMMPEAVYQLTLTRIGRNETKVLKAKLKNTVTIGRRKSNGLVVDDDEKVSGNHCVLCKRDAYLELVDTQSTNGTWLNGIPVERAVRVEQDDIIFFGSHEYRVNWESIE